MTSLHIRLLILSLLYLNISKAQDKHVILITIDGLRPEFYKDSSWAMVNLRQAMKTGSYADGVNGVFPTVTYPSHTSMITGVRPSKHGVYYNTPPEPLGVTGKWFWDYGTIKVPTVFTAAKAKALKTASVFWPVSVNSIADYTIPEYWYLPKAKGEPRVMAKALADHTSPKGLFEELQKKALGELSEEDFDGDYLLIDENLARTASYIIRQYKPAFLSLHLVTVDHFEHEQGRDGNKVRSAVAAADHAVKTVMEAVERAGIKDKTTFIVTGDHGFVDVHQTLAPNVLLAKAGLYDPQDQEKWQAYFHSVGGASFLHLKDRNSKKVRDKVVDLLKSLPATEQQKFVIKDKAALDKIGADPNAVLALAAQKGYSFTGAATGDFVRKGKGGTHGFYPNFKEIQTGFVAFGAGIKKGVVIPEMELVDIAPLVSELLALYMPEGDGVLRKEILK